MRRVHHFEVELRGVKFALSSPMMAIGALGDVPRTLKPFGKAVTRSPWLIQTGYFSPLCQTPSNNGVSSVTVTSARPNSR